MTRSFHTLATVAALIANAACPLLPGPGDVVKQINAHVVVANVEPRRIVTIVVDGKKHTPDEPTTRREDVTFDLVLAPGHFDGVVAIARVQGAEVRCGTFALDVAAGAADTAIIDADTLERCDGGEGEEGEGGEGEGEGDGEGEGESGEGEGEGVEGEGEGVEGEGEGDDGEGEGEGDGGPGGAPHVTIVSPENNAVFAAGASIDFECAAVDPQDGQLLEQNFRWQDNDAQFGIGPVVQTAREAGEHEITCEVSDSDGNSGVDTIHICVGDAC